MKKNKETGIRRIFTLIEMLTAMAIFMIISVIMMQFFNSAQQIIGSASQRNVVFSDARIAFDLITKDLQCTLFNNNNGALPGSDKFQAIYPFLFQRIDAVISNNYYHTDIYSAGITWDMLSFMATTEIRADNSLSNICELRYSFVPAGEVFTNPDSGSVIEDGWLIRSCTADKWVNPGTGVSETNPRYNFSENYLRSTAVDNDNRINKIWIDTSGAVPSATNAIQGSPSYVNFEKVIPYVYNLQFTCYEKDMTVITPIDFSSATVGNKMFGSEFPSSIKIELDMLKAKDWRDWKKAINDGRTDEANTIIKEKLQRFSKIIFMPRIEDY
ncbi:MAG: type II secretion system GspH family protein [Victivallaceae bacterium]|nr:type II secretion system GspH family protein [Victivallaceae bacterium]